MKKIKLFIILLFVINNIQSQIETKTINIDSFFVLVAQLEEMQIFVDLSDKQENNDLKRRYVYIKAKNLHKLFGDLNQDTLNIEGVYIPSYYPLNLKEFKVNTSNSNKSKISLKDYSYDSVSSDSVMILSLWKCNEKLYTYSNYKETSFINKDGKTYKNIYQFIDVPINNDFIVDVRLFYDILTIKSKKERIKQLKDFAKLTQIPSLQKKCAEILNNNIEYGDNLGKPIDEKIENILD